jgi:hypothetical protein
MTTHAVNSILARCLLEAEFLARLGSDRPAALGGYALDGGTRDELLAMDIAPVRKLAGFIVKVQNNHLWGPMPDTRALLKYYGVELQTFLGYQRTHHKLRAAGAPQRVKVTAFMRYLGARIRAGAFADCPGLPEVFLHERCLWEVGDGFSGAGRPGAGPDGDPPAGPRGPDGPECLRPAVRGALRVGRYRIDPFEVDRLLAEGRFAPGALAPSPCVLGYWRGPLEDRTRLLRLDTWSAAMLQLADGRRTVATITEELRGPGRAGVRTEDVGGFFEGAARLGVVRLAP